MATNIGLERALAELAYSIIYADGIVEDSEVQALEEMLGSICGKTAEQVRNAFHMLGERSSPNTDQAYRNAMFAIRENRELFDEQVREQFTDFMEKLAASSVGLREEEKHLVARFREDIRHM